MEEIEVDATKYFYDMLYNITKVVDTARAV